MDIDTALRELGEVDCAALGEVVLAQEEVAWRDDNCRQDTLEVHHDTESIALVSVDLERWPDITVSREAGWDVLSEVALLLMNDIISRLYPPGGTVIRAMASRLRAGKKITPHVDQHPSFHYSHRIHVPITTNPRVRFMIDGQPHQFRVGEAYELNNQKQHSVMNKGSEDRITFIFDYLPPERLQGSP